MRAYFPALNVLAIVLVVVPYLAVCALARGISKLIFTRN